MTFPDKNGKRPTIREIAKAIGVSRTTVSLGLKNDRRISSDTCERVQKAAKEMGYQADPKVAQLMAYLQKARPQKGRETFAYITPFSSREEWWNIVTFREYFLGAKKRSEELGYNVEEFQLKADGMSEKNINRVLFHRGIRGLFIAPSITPHAHIDLEWSRYATVSIGFSFDHPDTYRVTSDHYNDAVMALKRLTEYGYKRIGFFLNPNNNESTRRLWLSAYLIYQQEISRKHRIPQFIGSANSSKFIQWFQKNRPEVLLGDEDRCLSSLKTAGITCPNDYGLTLIDAENYSGCAGLYRKPNEVGECAANHLAGLLLRNELGLPKITQVILVQSEWRDGKTLIHQPR